MAIVALNGSPPSRAKAYVCLEAEAMKFVALKKVRTMMMTVSAIAPPAEPVDVW